MSRRNLLSISEACAFLQVSRPTFNSYRKKYSLSFSKVGREYRFLKSELIAKIFQSQPPPGGSIDLLMGSSTGQISNLRVDSHTFDLRRLNLIDGFGMFALMAEAHHLLSQGDDINFILDDQFGCRYLCELNFFKELQRQFPKNLFLSCTPTTLALHPSGDSFLPLTKVGFKNAEQSALEQDVLPILKTQGFSDGIAGYIFWMVGELMDNAHTHAKASGHCYVAIHRFGTEKKYLQIDVCDFGIGIPKTIREGSTYRTLSDKQALAKAFRSGVSSWPPEHERGKGLSDILGVAIGNQSILQVESGGQGFLLSFSGMGKFAQLKDPLASTPGTRISLVLIDKEFRQVPRSEADIFVTEYLEKL